MDAVEELLSASKSSCHGTLLVPLLAPLSLTAGTRFIAAGIVAIDLLSRVAVSPVTQPHWAGAKL